MGSSQKSLVLIRDVEGDPPPPLPNGFTSVIIRSTTDEAFPLLRQASEADGMPPGWAEQMLDSHGEAHLLLADAATVAGSAWISRGPYYISEIRRGFDPGPHGDYYFGDFIRPPFRGRKLHRVLIDLRLASSHAAKRRWAIGMTHATNLPSVAGYRSAGFDVAAEIVSRRLWRWRMDSIAWRQARPDHARFSSEGLPVPGLGRLRRL